MPRFHLPAVPAICTALVLAALPVVQAETKAAAWVGKTRDEALAQLGEPKSNIRVGSREMLFFAKVKLTLRNGVVTEMEDLPDELPPPVAAPAPRPGSEASAAAGASQPVEPTASEASAAAEGRSPDATSKTARPKPAEPALSIKFVKSSSGVPRSPAPAPTVTVPPTAVPPPPVAVKPVAIPSSPAARPEISRLAPPKRAAVEPQPVPVEPNIPAAAPVPADRPVVATSVALEPHREPLVDAKMQASRRRDRRARQELEAEKAGIEFVPRRTLMVSAIVIAGGLAYLWWRARERRLGLEASAASRSPFAVAVSPDAAVAFTADQLGRLSQQKFEQLVASYYTKTGVVAERTQAGPSDPVHIKIFWKGEPKPFAAVQCHANPPALIQAEPLALLFETLSTAGIRRGYVVTTGKFGVEARDYAAEKTFTLLSGDLLLEKLNALPPMARAELFKETIGTA